MATNIGSGYPEYRLAGRLGGRYEITRLLASGGMAEVYEARDTVLDRRVAVKVLHATYGADSEFVERFRREAMAAGQLNHPNIVQVYDWGRSDDGQAFMAMELVEGTTLRDLINEHGRIAPATAAQIASQVCAALEVARSAGIAHRDIKPENILLTADGQAKVADFGVARALAESRATQAGVIMGTASYLAPEQVEGQPGDHRSDLYALGTVIYEMVTGAPPFGGDNPVVVAYRRVAEEVPRLRSVVREVPAALDTAVARATARHPADRFSTAADMGAALAPVAREARDFAGMPGSQGRKPDRGPGRTTVIPVSAAETQMIRRPAPPKKTRRRRIVTLIVALLIAGGLVPVGLHFLATIAIPQVRGMTQEAATRSLQRAGFTVDSVLKNDPTVPQGAVISTDPPANAKARRGAKIALAVSLGPKLVTVPSLAGKTEAAATALLNGLHLKIVRLTAFSASIAKGTVIEQVPGPDVSVREGTAVKMTVSQGVEQVLIPQINGKTLDEARSALQQAGFTVTVTRAVNDSVPKDQVVSSSPAQNARAPRGSAVTVNVSDGPSTVSVPDVRGEIYEDGKRIIEAAGLKAARKQVPGSYGNTVVSTVPRPGAKVKRGTTVILYCA